MGLGAWGLGKRYTVDFDVDSLQLTVDSRKAGGGPLTVKIAKRPEVQPRRIEMRSI